MDTQSSIIDLSRHIGSLEQRMDSMEKYIVASTKTQDSKLESDNKFNYPFEIDFENMREATRGELQSIKQSLYDVFIVRPFSENPEEQPQIFNIRITRDELDMYLSQKPSEYGEYIYEIKPLYKDYL